MSFCILMAVEMQLYSKVTVAVNEFHDLHIPKQFAFAIDFRIMFAHLWQPD